MSLIFANIIGFIVAKWRWFVGAGAVLIFVIGIGLVFRACKPKPTVMTEQEKQEVKEQIANREETKLKEKLVELETKEAVIEGNVANADSAKINAIAESRKKWANANISELQAEFDRRMGQ